MGYSERTGRAHNLADRIEELGSLTEALEVEGPVLVVAHDWGGPISLGWAERHPELVAGIVLLNTAASQPDAASVPPLISAARAGRLLRTVTQRTPTFLEGTLRLAHPALSRQVANAYRAPYREASRRQAIADFVADIPLEPDHPSRATLDGVADRLTSLRDVPTLLIWGPRDPVFADRYLRDLQRRLPHSQTHRFEGAGHLVIEDAPVADTVRRFADDLAAGRARDLRAHPTLLPATTAERRTLWSALDARADDNAVAVVEMGRRGPERAITWGQLAATVRDVAAGLTAVGVRPEERVALLVPPGADLTAVLYATWRAGAVPVVADSGLGLPGLRRALRGAGVQHVIGVARGLSAAKGMGLPGTFISVGGFAPGVRRALGVDYTVVELAQIGRQLPTSSRPPVTAEAAVLFTSGATGPAKGVVYRHAQLEAQRDLVRDTFGIRPDDRLVAAFAPFALFGPALGIASVVPDMDVTKPGTLTARALADAVAAIDATLVFAAPASLRNIVRTAKALDGAQRQRCQRVRLLMSAGAPVPRETLRAASALLGDCAAHTPYGMTEALPVADVTLAELDAGGRGNGVLVGHPVPGVQVAISPFDTNGSATGPLTDAAEVTGEICVRGPHVKDHYDQLWSTQRESARDHGWHRTGDLGHLDGEGRLWVEGRAAHVIATAVGPVTPGRSGAAHRAPGRRSPGCRRGCRASRSASCRRRRGSPVAVEGRRVDRADRCSAPGGRHRLRRGARRRSAAGRHPAQLQDRSSASRRVGYGDTRRAPGDQRVRVLVTGGTSLLGESVARRLVERGDEVVTLQRGESTGPWRQVRGDIRDAEAVSGVVRGVDAVIHLAAKVSVTGDWAEFETINVGGTQNVLDAMRAHGVGRLVHVSSPSVAHFGEPLVAADADPADPERARGNYARSKAIAEQRVLAAADDSLAAVAIRPHLVWGPGDTQLVGRIVERAASGRLVLIDGGTALIDTTYIDNAADALVAALNRVESVTGEAFVVSNAEPRTVAELLTRICRAAGVPEPTRSVPRALASGAGAVVERVWSASSREGEPPMTRFLAEQLSTAHWFDQQRTQQRLGWTPAVSLAEGFERLAASYPSHNG